MMFARHTSRARAVAEVSDLGKLRTRAAFTLIELLVVVVIIGILAGMAMAVMFTAQEAARRSRTEGLISVLDSQMAYRFDSYRTRRVPINPAMFLATDTMEQTAIKQLIARRQLMRIELPDRWWDVAFDDRDDSDGSPDAVWFPLVDEAQQLSKDFLVPTDRAYDGTDAPGPTFDPPFNKGGTVVTRFKPPLTDYAVDSPWRNVERRLVDMIFRTSLSRAYMRRYQQVLQQRGVPPTDQYQGAEGLYMILTTGMGDETTGGGTFNERDFADVDDDGMPEFVDGWGKPIQFLRWAPGFPSDMQSGDATKDHDPFDPRRVDNLAYRLFPLIYSAGPDGAFGEDGSTNNPGGVENHRLTLKLTSTNVNLNDPYAPADDGSNLVFRGDRHPETAGIGPGDNIFNHSLQVR